MTTLPPKLDFWITNELNVLLVGRHGVGKTSLITQAFAKHNLSWKYFSASTMDPWVDFVGVPKEKTDAAGNSYLDLIRPLELQLDQYDAIFFDEFNRAPSKVRNAVMELIQFKSINGKKFNRLKMIWAAINPSDDDSYNVDELDPAQQDRFHIIHHLPNEPSKEFFEKKYGATIAKRAINWWRQLPDDKKIEVSPRRLEYAVDLYIKGGDLEDVLPRSVMPRLFKISMEGSTDKLTPATRWQIEPEEYLKELKDRKQNKDDLVKAFVALQAMSRDMFSTFVYHLPVGHLTSLLNVPTLRDDVIRGAQISDARMLATALTQVQRTYVGFDIPMQIQKLQQLMETDSPEMHLSKVLTNPENNESWREVLASVYTRTHVANQLTLSTFGSNYAYLILHAIDAKLPTLKECCIRYINSISLQQKNFNNQKATTPTSDIFVDLAQKILESIFGRSLEIQAVDRNTTGAHKLLCLYPKILVSTLIV